MNEKKILRKNMKIYCDDLEKSIDKDGCYNAKGSTICKACIVKPVPKKAAILNKDKKQ
ncbi:MAG: hypothetical protein ISR96_11180 [Nitrospira sp.]|nr:hypothetical protein [bacterium]MBL7050068.1 hypothetical protein [Nitrospira sp.]